MLVLNLPFKALMFLTLMRPSLVLFLVLWLKLVKDFLKVRCRLALLPFLISCLIWLDLVASLPLIKERILVIILLLHFLSLMLGSVLVLMLPLLVWLTPDLRIKKSLLKCNWTIRKRLPRCKMRLKKRLLAFSRRLHARIRKTRYMHKMRCLLINRRSLLLALRDRKSGSAGMPRPISYAVFCLKKKKQPTGAPHERDALRSLSFLLQLATYLPFLSAMTRRPTLPTLFPYTTLFRSEMQNETQKEIAGIQSATSRQNTKDQVYAQNEMLAYQQKESTARVASIMENTNLSKQQQVSEIMRQMLTQAQTAGQYFTNDQIKEMTRKVSAEVDLVHQQTQNQRYGSSHIGATAKDISNVVTDAASGVVDIFHGIDKAVADTSNNFWKDGIADGIRSNLSRK